MTIRRIASVLLVSLLVAGIIGTASSLAFELDLDAFEIVREWDFSEEPLPFREDAKSVTVVIDGEERSVAQITVQGQRNDLAIFPKEKIVVTDMMALVVEYRVDTPGEVAYTMVYVYTTDGRVGQEHDGGTPVGEWVRAVYLLEDLRVAPHAQTPIPVRPGNEISRIQIFSRLNPDDTVSTLSLARLMLVQPRR